MDAIINLYKPEGMTSFKCVAAVRRILGTKKVGHGGTLDPEASGVLPICVGKATKLIEFFLLCKKSYRGKVQLGLATDTQDVWGQTLETKDPSFVKEEDFFRAAGSFVGELQQIPPAYSAIKVGGVPMYKRARQGTAEEVELAPRNVHVYSLSPSSLGSVEISENFGVPVREATLDVTCSRGTYIRTLCYDLGQALDVPACMSYLCRTSYGPYALEDAITLEELEEAAKIFMGTDLDADPYEITVNGKIAFHQPGDILTQYPKITVNDKQFARFLHGQETFVYGDRLASASVSTPDGEEPIARLFHGDRLVAVVHFFMGTDLEGKNVIYIKPWKFLGGEE